MRTVTELFYSPANEFSLPASIIHRKSSFNQKVAYKSYTGVMDFPLSVSVSKEL